MKIYKTKNYDEMSKKAAHIIASQVILNPDCVLGLLHLWALIKI